MIDTSKEGRPSFTVHTLGINFDDLCTNVQLQYLEADETEEIERTFVKLHDPGDDSLIAIEVSNDTYFQILVWDLYTNREVTNFSGRNFKDYYTGPSSRLGYCAFENYEVNLDTGVPEPLGLRPEPRFLREKTQGWRTNSAADTVLLDKNMLIKTPYTDLVFREFVTRRNVFHIPYPTLPC